MMKYTYKTGRWNNKPIEKLEVVKETAKTITILEPSWDGKKFSETRYNKDARYQFHETWSAAHEHLMNEAQVAVISARRTLELANAKLGNIKGMKEPTE